MNRQIALIVLLACPAALAATGPATGPAPAPTPAPTVEQVRQCLAANLPQAVRIQNVEMTSWDRDGGERTLKGRIFAARDRNQPRLMARVEFPHDVAGTAFLVRESEPSAEMYIYLPSQKRVRRLTGASLGGKLWGTDFSYDEFRQVANAFAGGAIEIVGAAQHQGRGVHVLDLRSDDRVSETVRVLVDQQSCVPLQAEFASAGKVRKRMTAPVASLRRSGERWYADELLLQDLVQGTRTRLRVLGVASAQKLSAGYFNPSLFHEAH